MRRRIVLVICLSILGIASFILTIKSNLVSAKIVTTYTDPAQLTSLPFGTHSHWLQPWRSYLETVPATKFLDGIGMTFRPKPKQNPEILAQMLAKYGVTQARIEINWGELSYHDETQFKQHKKELHKAHLLALKKAGIRPLVLLNANHSNPCPAKILQRTLTTDAKIGDTLIELDNVSGIKTGYSGLSNLTESWAAEALITAISDRSITLSKPLPRDLAAGTEVTIATLKYRPFSEPGTNSYRETMTGWQRYVEMVSEFVTDTLETTNSNDRGFDLEIWNELTFGSNFLNINHYYEGTPYEYPKNSIWSNLVSETADYLESHPEDFQGVRVVDGFTNTIPWGASSTLPKRIAALGKHPYPRMRQFPEAESQSDPVDALYQKVDKSSAFIPSYISFLPEYYATALQTETIVRDIAPITTSIYGTEHGRAARKIAGETISTPVWITEVNTSPRIFEPNITAEQALKIKAKTSLRYYCFYLNKGVERVYLFSTVGENTGFGMVKENFQKYAAQSDLYPSSDRIYVAPAFEAMGRIVAKMGDQIDRNLTQTRQLEVVSISDLHHHYQFKGNGTTNYPNLFDRDVLALLPFQVNAHKFVIPYYVMTQNVMTDLKPEKFTVQLKGIARNGVRIWGYDPIGDRTIFVPFKQKENSLQLELVATDYPYLLIIQETAS